MLIVLWGLDCVRFYLAEGRWNQIQLLQTLPSDAISEIAESRRWHSYFALDIHEIVSGKDRLEISN